MEGRALECVFFFLFFILRCKNTNGVEIDVYGRVLRSKSGSFVLLRKKS